MTQNVKLTYTALVIYSVGYVALSATWCFLAQMEKPSEGVLQYIAYIHDALLMLTAHILTILNPSQSQSAQPQQAPSMPSNVGTGSGDSDKPTST
jgi:hypothetical protein